MISIKNNIALLIISSIVAPTILIGIMYNIIAKLTYTYSKKQGGEKYILFKSKFKNIIEKNLEITGRNKTC